MSYGVEVCSCDVVENVGGAGSGGVGAGVAGMAGNIAGSLGANVGGVMSLAREQFERRFTDVSYDLLISKTFYFFFYAAFGSAFWLYCDAISVIPPGNA